MSGSRGPLGASGYAWFWPRTHARLLGQSGPLEARDAEIDDELLASKIRQAVGGYLGGWSEQMLRAQIETGGLIPSSLLAGAGLRP